MKSAIAIITAAVLGIQAMPVQAKHYEREFSFYDRVQQRQDNQYRRIQDGIRTGELTHKEARRLRKQQRYIAHLKYRFLNDGRLNRYEYRTLNKELDQASDHIYRLKHNDRYRHHHHDKPNYR
jgi:hypothetical protein